MGFSQRVGRLHVAGFSISCLLLACLGSGCQLSSAAISQRDLYQQSLLDFSGLRGVESFDPLKICGAVPEQWDPLPIKQTPLYTHEQWRNPGVTTGVGVAYIHTPFPLPASAILWFARREYTRQEEDGRALDQWTDAEGREWFEAENSRFHVRGYVATRGFDAWIVYCGYKRAHPPTPRDISLAVRSAETMVPGVLAK